MAGLPDDYRQVLELHDEQGLTNPEIAEKLGISLAAVKIRLHRARARLRVCFEESCEIGPDEEGASSCEPA
jgi:RNA polymerase sigma-70 factor (ECF subfamily)